MFSSEAWLKKEEHRVILIMLEGGLGFSGAWFGSKCGRVKEIESRNGSCEGEHTQTTAKDG